MLSNKLQYVVEFHKAKTWLTQNVEELIFIKPLQNPQNHIYMSLDAIHCTLKVAP